MCQACPGWEPQVDAMEKPLLRLAANSRLHQSRKSATKKMFMASHVDLHLVGGLNPSEKYESQLG